MEMIFNQIAEILFNELSDGETLSLSFKGENSQFIRLNNASVRQTGLVDDAYLGLRLINMHRTCSGIVTLSNNIDEDRGRVVEELNRLRAELPQLPEDPFIVMPGSKGSSHEVKQAIGLQFEQAIGALLPPMQGMDLVGIWASGKIYYGAANSLGQKHWFETDSHSLDYSLVSSDHKMVKGSYAGSDWNQTEYEKSLADSRHKLKMMAKKTVKMKPGNYRAWFAPHAVHDFIDLFNWNGISEASLRQGCSGFGRMRNESVRLSPKFSLSEDFTYGLTPRFNSNGEVASKIIPLIQEGDMVNALVSSRTASEYGLEPNYAEDSETLRSPVMATGDLKVDDVLEKLDTGIYLSNIHYLNWSDTYGGRVTGLTRYACFWVEKAEIVGPLETMRFDDTLFRFLGSELEAVGSKSEIIPDVLTYEGRNSDCIICPGMLVNSFSLTL